MCLAYAPTVSDSNHMLFFFLLHLDSLLRNSVETTVPHRATCMMTAKGIWAA